MPTFKQCKLAVFDSEGKVKHTIDLFLSSAARASRSAVTHIDTDSDIQFALDSVAEFALLTASTLRERLKPPQDEARKLRRMLACLDLRQMASDPAYAITDVAKLSLDALTIWMRSRFLGANDLDDMPAAPQMHRQLEMLAHRLQTAAKEPEFSHWSGASGTVIMRDVFTMRRFYRNVPDYLYLFSHMATKTMCEAVVEGMGGVWDRSADPRRHPHFETGVLEAVVAWSAPNPWHPEANLFIAHALDHAFPNGWQHEFAHRNSRTEQILAGNGQVLNRLAAAQPRFPWAFYDVSA